MDAESTLTITLMANYDPERALRACESGIELDPEYQGAAYAASVGSLFGFLAVVGQA